MRRRRYSLLLAACFFAALPCYSAEFLVYAGTYTNHASKGIYAWRFQTAGGKLTPLGLAASTGNPTFLVENPNHQFLYAVNENGDAGVLGSVSAYAIDAHTARLTLINWVSSKGGAPCHLAVDRSGKWLAVANCAGGSLALLPIRADGGLGEAAALDRQANSHPEAVVFSPDNRFLFVAQKGLDRIQAYRFDAGKGAIIATAPAPCPGVGRLAFHPNGQALYALSESKSTVTAFHYTAASGVLAEFETVPAMPPDFPAEGRASELAVNASGKVLYAAIPGMNALAQFAIDPGKFTLTPMEFPPVMGRAPRRFALDPTGAFLFVANRESSNLTVFHVHPHTGQLQPAMAIGKNVPDAACVIFVPVRVP